VSRVLVSWARSSGLLQAGKRMILLASPLTARYTDSKTFYERQRRSTVLETKINSRISSFDTQPHLLTQCYLKSHAPTDGQMRTGTDFMTHLLTQCYLKSRAPADGQTRTVTDFMTHLLTQCYVKSHAPTDGQTRTFTDFMTHLLTNCICG
jgi:hypothetical protein